MKRQPGVEIRPPLDAILNTLAKVTAGVMLNLLLALGACWLTGGITSIRLSDYLFYEAGLLTFIAFCTWMGNISGRASWRYQAGGTASRSASDLAHFARQEEQNALSFAALLILIAGVMAVLSILASELL